MGGKKKNCHLDSKEHFMLRRQLWGQRFGRPTYQLGFWFWHFTRHLTHRRHLSLSHLPCLRLSFLIWGVCLLLRKGADAAGFNFPDRTALNGGAPLLNNIIKKCTRKNFISQHCNFFFSFCRFNTDSWWISVSLSCIEGFWTWTAKMVWNSWGMVGTIRMLC